MATADLAPRTLADREAWFAQFGPSFPLVVAEEGGAVVGYAGVAPYSARDGYRWTGEILVYVARAARGRGLGRRLLARTLEEARAAGLRYLHARIFAHNGPSLKLHRDLGFRDVGILRAAAYLDPAGSQGIDVHVLELHPQGAPR